MRKLSLLLFVLTACGSMCSSACGPSDSGGSGDVDASLGGDAAIDAPFTCDPLLQTGCTMGKACYSDLYLSTTGDPGYYCAAPGTGTQGTNCNADIDCATGFWCLKYVDPSNVPHQICSRYCHQGCTGGGTCVETQGATFGYCI